MNDEDAIRQSTAWSTSSPPSALNAYELLIRQSRKLGRTATDDVARDQIAQVAATDSEPTPKVPLSTKITKAAKSTLRLNNIIRQSREILASAQTVILPNNLFPDKVVLDRTKVTITQNTFFWSASVISIRIEDILNVSTSVGPLFGSLTISSRVMNSTDHYEINYFWRSDAIRLKHMIQGYMIAIHNDIDTSALGLDELGKMLQQLGHDPSA